MRRRAPRPLAAALAQVAREAAPATVLARVQGAWRGAVGEAVAAEAEPVSERGGVVTVRCASAVWAQELELLSGELLERLNGALGEPAAVRELRFRAGGRGNP